MTALVEIEQAKREALQARGRFERTLAAVQQRFHPGSLAEEAWDGVKDKGADLAFIYKRRPKGTANVVDARTFMRREL